MIVLDEPYVSEPLIAWLEESQHPVLDNAFARSIADGRALNLVSSDEAVRRIDAGERVYTNSENALAWIVESAHNESLSRAIGLFKDKAAMRAALAGLDPDLFFKSCSVDELFKLDFSQLPAPFVLKPSVGFCSMGVYAIQNREDWERALADIQQAILRAPSTRWTRTSTRRVARTSSMCCATTSPRLKIPPIACT